MPKYLVVGSYTVDGIKGVLREGGSGRVDAVGKLLASVGGTVDSFYFALGKDDFYVVVDMPDNVAAAAVGMTIAAAGGVSARTVALLTPEEVDEATHRSPAYRPPGA